MKQCLILCFCLIYLPTAFGQAVKIRVNGNEKEIILEKLENGVRKRQAIKNLKAINNDLQNFINANDNNVMPNVKINFSDKKLKLPSKKVMPKEVKEADLKINPELLKKITLLSKQLGDKNFKTRKAATKELKAIGSDIARKQKKSPSENIIVIRMNKLLKHEDPEVKERAKDIINTIVPKKVLHGNRRKRVANDPFNGAIIHEIEEIRGVPDFGR